MRMTSLGLRIMALLGVSCAATVLFFASQIDNYLNARLFNRISGSVAIIALIAVGQTFVILTRNIDLSIGSIVGCTAFFTGGILVVPIPTCPPPLVPALAMMIGAIFGAVNGLSGRPPSAVDHRDAGHAGDLPVDPGAKFGRRRSPPTACPHG
jgi:rhamnose transport system permease protein